MGRYQYRLACPKKIPLPLSLSQSGKKYSPIFIATLDYTQRFAYKIPKIMFSKHKHFSEKFFFTPMPIRPEYVAISLRLWRDPIRTLPPPPLMISQQLTKTTAITLSITRWEKGEEKKIGPTLHFPSSSSSSSREYGPNFIKLDDSTTRIFLLVATFLQPFW